LLQKRPRARSHPNAPPPRLLPPNLRTLDARSFTHQDRETLRAWLVEDGWPRGTMDIGMLEGYLVALLVWPVDIAPGAFLPPIWGERAGWRVPAKIATPEAFDKFIALVVGLLQHLDHGLGGCPPVLVPTLCTDEPKRRGPRTPGVSWAQGFLRALQQNAQGLQVRSDAARTAAAGIAHYASFVAPSPGAFRAVAKNLTSAVLTLVSQRPSRGPLGALETDAVPLNFAAPVSPARASRPPRRRA
jgi:yecA family protein